MRPSRTAPLLAAILLLPACGPELVREPVYTSEQRTVRIELRRMVDGDQSVPRGFRHPATISDVRLAHILAHFTYKDKKGRKHPVIRSEHVYDLAEGMNKAFRLATPDDEVVAEAYGMDRRLQIFTVDKVTAFQAHFDPDYLLIEFFAIEKAVEKDPTNYSKRTYKVPNELSDKELPVELLPGTAYAVRNNRGYQIDWRDPVFARPISMSLRGGKLRRRTILLEAEPEDEAPEASGERERPEPGDAPAAEMTPEQRDAQLRALDELDGARRSGLVTELEFQRRRRLILEGRLEEAGYGPGP